MNGPIDPIDELRRKVEALERRQPRRRHKEAFCLMTYEDRKTGERERIWNSRDGVTPYIIRSRAGNEARHVDWNRDTFRPQHVPQVGERIFVDLTPRRAVEIVRSRVDAYWDDPVHPMSQRWPSKEAAIVDLVASFPDGEPDLIEVTDAW
jgi:hypothetical protein